MIPGCSSSLSFLVKRMGLLVVAVKIVRVVTTATNITTWVSRTLYLFVEVGLLVTWLHLDCVYMTHTSSGQFQAIA